MKLNSASVTLFALLTLASVPAQDWQSLFDGKTLSDWKPGGNVSSLKVLDGQIVCDGPRPHLFYVGPDGLADFTNFEFSTELLTRNGANSAVYFHTEFQDEGFPKKGFEAQVLNVPGGEDGYRENKLTGSLYGIRNVYKAMARDDEWFGLDIVVKGKRIQVRVNDLLLVDYVEATPPLSVPGYPGRKLAHGPFSLQCHDAGSKVFFRNLRVKRLPSDASDSTPPALRSRNTTRKSSSWAPSTCRSSITTSTSRAALLSTRRWPSRDKPACSTASRLTAA